MNKISITIYRFLTLASYFVRFKLNNLNIDRAQINSAYSLTILAPFLTLNYIYSRMIEMC